MYGSDLSTHQIFQKTVSIIKLKQKFEKNRQIAIGQSHQNLPHIASCIQGRKLYEETLSTLCFATTIQVSSYSFRGNYSRAVTIQGRKLLIIRRF